MTDKYGVKLPDGFNGANLDVIETLFEMTVNTIDHKQLYHGWTISLKRSPLGEWRFIIVPEDK